MYRIVKGNTHCLNDVEQFIDLINDPSGEIRNLFDFDKEIFVARAPGRLDVMGGIGDYSGSLVLEMPIAEATLVALQKSNEDAIKIISLSKDSQRDLIFEMPLSQFGNDWELTDYEEIREFFSRNLTDHWASYVAGVFFILKGERKINFRTGARILIYSQIPIGKGVSSSAALEVATMQAVCAANDISIEPRGMAMLCQMVENCIAGAPCGVMDQITSHCGLENSLISILCQPAQITSTMEIPRGIELWGIDSGVRHAVTGSDYSSVRIGAFMGYRIIAELAGFESQNPVDDLVVIEDDRWHGYLSNISPAEYERSFSSQIPKTMHGGEFLERYKGTTDRATKIDPEKIYAVKAPTEHGIYEHTRVKEFCELLAADNNDNDERLTRLGELMFQSNAGYAACGLNEPRTDRIVDLVRDNRDHGLFGARITGGGSGGTVAILGKRSNSPAVAEIMQEYEEDTGRKSYIFHGSSPGCAAFGYLRLENS